MSLLDLAPGQIKTIKVFIDEIPDSKILPEGPSGTRYPPSKDQKPGGWRYDEQGFTTRAQASNMQIQLNTEGGVRGPSALLILVSTYGLKNKTITDKLIRTALHQALNTTPRRIYVTHDGKLITDLEAFHNGEASVAPDDGKKGKKKSDFLPYPSLTCGRIELYCHHGVLELE